MAERFSRRGVLAGMTFAAADLLFSREISAAAQDVPAIGNSHLLTLTAVSEKDPSSAGHSARQAGTGK